MSVLAGFIAYSLIVILAAFLLLLFAAVIDLAKTVAKLKDRIERLEAQQVMQQGPMMRNPHNKQ